MLIYCIEKDKNGVISNLGEEFLKEIMKLKN
jgi:hypothetical protein